MTRSDEENRSPADLAALYDAQEIPKRNAHTRRKENISLAFSITLATAVTVAGIFAIFDPKIDPTVRTIASGWIGMVLGQIKKILPSE